MPSKCRSFQDLLVVQISCKLTEYWACNCILCHMALLGLKGLMASEFPQHFHELSVSATFIETQAKKAKIEVYFPDVIWKGVHVFVFCIISWQGWGWWYQSQSKIKTDQRAWRLPWTDNHWSADTQWRDGCVVQSGYAILLLLLTKYKVTLH